MASWRLLKRQSWRLLCRCLCVYIWIFVLPEAQGQGTSVRQADDESSSSKNTLLAGYWSSNMAEFFTSPWACIGLVSHHLHADTMKSSLPKPCQAITHTACIWWFQEKMWGVGGCYWMLCSPVIWWLMLSGPSMMRHISHQRIQIDIFSIFNMFLWSSNSRDV